MKVGLISLALTLMMGTGLLAEGNAWYSFNEGILKAKKENKHIVIDFYTDWCGWCKKMDKETFSAPAVEKYLFENFVPIRINAENATEKLQFQGKTYTPVQLTRAFQVTGYPSIALLTPGSEVVAVIPGYIEKDMFMNLLRYMKSESYKSKMTLEEFLKKETERKK
ncbi:MAG: thioredoxin family protein [Candidatus Neomarinimicrobiota bacterium]